MGQSTDIYITRRTNKESNLNRSDKETPLETQLTLFKRIFKKETAKRADVKNRGKIESRTDAS